jgi:hypothetical protein
MTLAVTNAAPANPQARYVTAVWRRLPAGTLSKSAAMDAVKRAAQIAEWDNAGAEVVLGTLVQARAVVATQKPGTREFTYEKAATLPQWPDMSPGSPARREYEQRLAREAEEARLRDLDRARQDQFANSVLGLQQRELQKFVTAAVTAELAPLVAEVAALREQVAELTRDACPLAA